MKCTFEGDTPWVKGGPSEPGTYYVIMTTPPYTRMMTYGEEIRDPNFKKLSDSQVNYHSAYLMAPDHADFPI